MAGRSASHFELCIGLSGKDEKSVSTFKSKIFKSIFLKFRNVRYFKLSRPREVQETSSRTTYENESKFLSKLSLPLPSRSRSRSIGRSRTRNSAGARAIIRSARANGPLSSATLARRQPALRIYGTPRILLPFHLPRKSRFHGGIMQETNSCSSRGKRRRRNARKNFLRWTENCRKLLRTIATRSRPPLSRLPRSGSPCSRKFPETATILRDR